MDLQTLFSGPLIWFVAKIFVLIGLGVYVAFAIIVVRQVQLMMDTAHLGLERVLTLIAWLHLLAAIGLFALAFLFL